MTKRNYKLIAMSVRFGYSLAIETFEKPSSSAILSFILDRLAVELSKDNPKFNAQKFRDAVLTGVKL